MPASLRLENFTLCDRSNGVSTGGRRRVLETRRNYLQEGLQLFRVEDDLLSSYRT